MQSWWHILEYLKWRFVWAAKSGPNSTGFLQVSSPLLLDWETALTRARLLLLFSLSLSLSLLMEPLMAVLVLQ